MLITALKNIAIIIWAIGAITISYMALSFSIDIPYHDLMFIFTKNEYFWFDGRHIAYLSAAPFLIFIIFILFIIIFSKDHQFPKSLSRFSGIITIITLISLILLNILSLFLYFYIIFFSSYKHCKETTLEHYFATELEVCHRINSHDSY